MLDHLGFICYLVVYVFILNGTECLHWVGVASLVFGVGNIDHL